MAFNAATAQPESAIRGFDPSSAEPEEGPKASFKFDADSAVPEIAVAPVRLDTRESPTISAYTPPPLGKRIGTAIRESGPVSFLLGETPNQKLQREFAASQLDQMAPGLGSIMRRAENPHAEKSRSNGALATTWESANRPTIHLPLASTEGLSDERTPLMIGPTEAEAAGIYNAAAPIAESLTSPLSIGTFGTVSLLNKLAKGFGPAAAAARATLRAMGLGFGAKLAQDTGEQAGQAVDVVNDPNATKAQKVAAVGAPILTGAASLASAASGVLPGRPAAPGPISDSELASARNVTPGSDADWSRRALEAKQPLALPEPQRALPAPAPSKPVETKGAPTADILPAEQVAAKATTPAVAATPFREGQEVVYSLPDGQEARGIVAAPTAYGRVKITTQAGENIRVPIARVRELPAEVNKVEGFDPSSAVAEIEVTLSEPETAPEKPATSSQPSAVKAVGDQTPEPLAEPLQASSETTPEAPSKVIRRIGVGLPAHGEPDILNAIEEHGGVETKSGARRPGGEHDDLTSTFTGPAKVLLRKSGVAPDQLAALLHSDGLLPDGYVTTMNDAVTAALRARQVAAAGVEKNSFHERFERAFLGNQHPREWLRSGKAVSIDDLRVGDRFEVDGDKFHVANISEDGVVTVKDGITREIQPGTEVFPDKGKITRAKSTRKIIEDFLPVEAEPASSPTSDWSLEAVTPEQQAAEAARQRELAKAQAQREKITALAEKPLTGDSSDVGQGVLLKGDEDLFSGPSAEESATNQPESGPTFGSQRGAIDPQLLRSLAVTTAGAGGAVYGYSQGDTPEEKLKNALLYGALGAIGMRLGTSPAVWRAGRSALFGNKELPNMRKVSDGVVNAANHVKGARLYGAMNGLNLAAKVLGPHVGDATFAERLGSVLVQEMQEAKIIQLHDDLAKAKTPGERARIQSQIDSVKPVWEMPATQINSPADFRAALADPEIIAAIDRHKALVQAEAERIHKELGGKLAAVGPNTGAFINTEAIVVGDRPITGQSRGNLQNVLKRKTAFGQGRTGTAEQYEIDYNRQVARMAAGNAERIATKEYYDTAERDGAMMRLPPGERPGDVENWRRERTQELSVTGKVEDTWIRKDIWGEHRQLMNTDTPISDNDLRDVAKEMTWIQMKGITDPVFHSANIVSQIVAAQGASNAWADLGRQFPGVNVGDALVRVGTRARDVIKNDPKTLEQLARLAKIGALREDHPGVVNLIDRAARLVMSDFHQNLVDRGLVDPSELSERDFVNKIGQYDPRVMGQTKAFLKELQVAPFVVAGQGMNRAGVQKLFLHPGVKPKDAAAWAKMVGVNLAGLIASAVVVPFAANYLLNRNDDRVKNKLMGPPGTPVGAIGWVRGDGAKAKNAIVDPLKWTGARRGARVTGLNALANGLTQGRDLNHSAGQAMQDIVNGAVQPWAGPAVNAAVIGVTGKSISGFQEAERVNPLDRTESPTLSQSAENVKTGVTHLQAQVSAGLQEARRNAREQEEFTAGGAAGAMGKSLLGAAGYREAKAGDAERGAAESARYQEETAQSARHNATAKLAAQWPKLTQAEREKAAQNMTERELQDLVEAIRQNDLGFTPADRMIHSMGVEDGARAKYLASQVMKLKGDEQLRYLDDKERKGLITEKVGEQLVEELQARGFKPAAQAAR